MTRVLIVAAVLASVTLTSSAQAPIPAYLVVGDSIEFGLGDDIPADGFGYVPLVAAFLGSVLGQPVATLNLGVPFATTRDIWQGQLSPALAAARGHAPVIISWGGGGNDLANVATGPQAAVCRRSESCLARFNAVLAEIEQTMIRTIGRLRAELGPQATILMRTQYNALLKGGCATPEVAALGTATLEGVPGTLLDRGLNDRIREVAARFDARVVDLFIPFAVAPDTLVSTDCVHPSGAGHQVIGTLSAAAFVAS